MKEQSTTKGFAVLSAAGMIVKLISLLYVPFLIAIIGREGYGVYAATYQVFLFIYVITNSGIPVAISKLVSELTATKNHKDAVKCFKIARGLLLAMGTIMTIVMMAAAVPLANATSRRAALAIKVLSPTIIFTAVLSAYRGYFQGRGNMTPTAVSQVIEQIVNTVFSLIFAAILIRYGIEAGAAGGTVGTTLGAAVALLFLILFYEKNKNFKVEYDPDELPAVRYSNKYLFKKLLSYSIPLTLCVGLQNAGALIDASNVLKRLLHAGFNESAANIMYGRLGQYNVLINVPISIISALAAAVLPAIASAAALKDKKQIQSKIRYAYRLCFLISVPAAVGLATLSGPIYKLIYPGANEGYMLMAYGSVVVILMSAVQIQTTILQSIGKLYTATFYLILGISAKIAVNYILVAKPSINILGAIFGNIISFIIPLVLNNKLIKNKLKIKYNLLGYAIRPIIASAFMGLVVYIGYYDMIFLLHYISKGYAANLISTGVSILLGGYVYLYGLILTGGITNGDLKSMPSKIKRIIPKRMLDRIK